jgi:hypothetical protein
METGSFLTVSQEPNEDHVLPCASAKREIAMLQIHLGNLQIHRRFAHRFVSCVEKSERRGPVTGMQTFLPAGRFVVNV